MSTAPQPIVFLDTETTGLSLDDDIWEVAAVRREPDGTEAELHLFVQHDANKCSALPPEFRADHQRRFPASTGTDWHPDARRPGDVARAVHAFTDGAYIVGAVPSFDTERLVILLERHALTPRWHYHLIDVENLVVGYLAAKGLLVPPPWKSDALSATVGVDPADFDRHTAMGDVRWVMAQWDAVMGLAPVGQPR